LALPPRGFLRPVKGALLSSFGAGRDAATGAWIFRAAASFSARAGEPVRCPGDGQVARVADSVAGGAAVVLVQAGWTIVVSGLDSVAVAAGESVRRGDVLGSSRRERAAPIRVETWRGRTPVDPVSVLRPQ
jgi:murein DD-endopeptidase MepM/ murein hydrolase activator NlpD